MALQYLAQNFECLCTERNSHAVNESSENCEANESKDDGSDTKQKIASTLDESINSVMLDYLQFSTMPHVRRAAYNLQLAIRDGLKLNTVASLTIKIRRIAIAARPLKIDFTLNRKKAKEPFLTKLLGRSAHISWLNDF